MIRYIFVAITALVFVVLGGLIVLLPTPNASTEDAAQRHTSGQKQKEVIFSNVTLFDGENLLSNHTVTVSQGIITSVEPFSEAGSDKATDATYAYTVVSTDGLTLLPGFIDAHTHTFGNGLVDALRFGVSTHLDMFGMERDLQRTKQARDLLTPTKQTDLYSAGTMATVNGGHGTQYGFAIDTIESFSEIAQWVSRRKQAGSDYIKLVYMPYQQRVPSLTREYAREVIQQAKRQGLLVLAHTSTRLASQDMIEDGINGLVHIFADELANEDLITLAKQNEVFIIPTLAVIAAADGHTFGQALIEMGQINPYLSADQKASLASGNGVSNPGYNFDIAKQNVKRFFDAGVPILAGSDAPNIGTAYGISALHETVLLVEAGLNHAQALGALTEAPARIFNLQGRGVIKKGARADLVLVQGNPINDINALYNIRAVYKNGSVVTR